MNHVLRRSRLSIYTGCLRHIYIPARSMYWNRAFYSAPRGEGDADFKIRGPATQKNYGNATAAPPEPGRNFGPAFGGGTLFKTEQEYALEIKNFRTNIS